MLEKAYMDNRDKCVNSSSVAKSGWDSDMVKATHTDGIINDPNGKGEVFAESNHVCKEVTTFVKSVSSVWLQTKMT